MTRLNPVHPGEILKHEFMEPFGLSSNRLAKHLGVTPARIIKLYGHAEALLLKQR